VGSGFIHFNYTPWGHTGDKATPSLIGDVVHGVFLRQERIFLGELSGIVGPQKVGFGSFTIAGQVLRRQIPASAFMFYAHRTALLRNMAARPAARAPYRSPLFGAVPEGTSNCYDAVTMLTMALLPRFVSLPLN